MLSVAARAAEATASASGWSASPRRCARRRAATRCTLQIVNLREELGRWYRSLGYREVGTQPYEHRPVKQPCHFVEMRKSLRPVTSLGAVAA